MEDKYTKILSCINCPNSELKKLESFLKCEKCNSSFKIKNDKIYFSKNFFPTNKWDDKNYYNFDLFERTKKIDMPNIIHGPKIGDLRKYLNLDDKEIAINLGGGSNKFENILNYDLGEYENVDIIGELENLPFKDETAKLLISNSVLEHVEDYQKCLKEVYRILKKDGFFYLCVPCNSMRHHRVDYRRWTMPGLKKLIESYNFKILESGVCRGPEMMIWYALESYLIYRTKPGLLREFFRRIILYFAKRLQFHKIENNEKTQALSVTNYVIVKKN